jgi:hypothetical protein
VRVGLVRRPLSEAAPRFAILTAIRNEERILGTFLDELRGVVERTGLSGRTTLWVVDDLSFDGSRELLLAYGRTHPAFAIELVSPPTNLGNQGAMAFGLQRVQVGLDDVLITLDSDGEDDVRELPSILELGRASPGHVVLIERGRRAESLRFKLFFAFYKALFRFLTGRRLVPNNFMLVPGRFVPAFRASPLAAVHFAYALYRLSPPHVATVRDRRPRYGGQTSQNLFMLVSHGLVGLMLFYEVVVAKLFMTLALLAGGLAGVVVLGLLLPERLVAQRTLAWCALALAVAGAGALGLLVAAALALAFKLAVYRTAVDASAPGGAATPPPAGGGAAPGAAPGGTPAPGGGSPAPEGSPGETAADRTAAGA